MPPTPNKSPIGGPAEKLFPFEFKAAQIAGGGICAGAVGALCWGAAKLVEVVVESAGVVPAIIGGVALGAAVNEKLKKDDDASFWKFWD